MSVFRVRKVAFINFGLLFIFLASWISWYMYPLARSVTKEFSFEYGFAAAEWEEHFFYGKVSYSSSSSGKNSIAAPAIAKALKVVYSQNQLFVTNPAASDMEVLVFDVQGNLKTRYRAYSAGEHQVSLQQLNQGVYIVRVETRGAVETLQVRVK